MPLYSSVKVDDDLHHFWVKAAGPSYPLFFLSNAFDAFLNINRKNIDAPSRLISKVKVQTSRTVESCSIFQKFNSKNPSTTEEMLGEGTFSPQVLKIVEIRIFLIQKHHQKSKMTTFSVW